MRKTKKLSKSEEVNSDYGQQVDDAYNELWDALGSEDFISSDFSDIAFTHGVDEDDLLDRLI